MGVVLPDVGPRAAAEFVGHKGTYGLLAEVAGLMLDACRVWRVVSRPLAPVAQLDRVLPSEGRGHWFESSRAHQFK